jgi:hypothetical protein
VGIARSIGPLQRYRPETPSIFARHRSIAPNCDPAPLRCQPGKDYGDVGEGASRCARAFAPRES